METLVGNLEATCSGSKQIYTPSSGHVEYQRSGTFRDQKLFMSYVSESLRILPTAAIKTNATETGEHNVEGLLLRILNRLLD